MNHQLVWLISLRSTSDAFNKGVKIASGELIGIINSDDMLTDNSLNIIAKNIKPETDVIYGNAIMFGGEKQTIVANQLIR